MSDVEKKPGMVWVQPVKGVYCELMYGEQTYKVWKVHPNTPNRFGTEVPYDLAVYFLGKVPPVITLVPNIKNGKHTSPLLPEDAEKIAASVKRGFVGGLKNYNETSKPALALEGATDSNDALRQALELLAKQTEANQVLQKTLADLSEKVEKLEKLEGSAINTPADTGVPPVPPLPPM
jgi:hypothetical protein